MIAQIILLSVLVCLSSAGYSGGYSTHEGLGSYGSVAGHGAGVHINAEAIIKEAAAARAAAIQAQKELSAVKHQAATQLAQVAAAQASLQGIKEHLFVLKAKAANQESLAASKEAAAAAVLVKGSYFGSSHGGSSGYNSGFGYKY